MIDRKIIILETERQREYGKLLIDSAPPGYVATISEMTRTLAQNAKLWPMLADVRRAKPGGRQHTDETWKALFLHSLGHQQIFEPALDDRGVVPMGFRSSQLGKRDFSDLIETIYEYGARHQIRWSEPNPYEIAA